MENTSCNFCAVVSSEVNCFKYNKFQTSVLIISKFPIKQANMSYDVSHFLQTMKEINEVVAKVESVKEVVILLVN